MNIGESIRRIRKEKGLSMKSLGKMVDVSEQAIGNYERGDRTPNIEVLNKIANALEVEIWELTSDKEDRVAIKKAENILKNFNPKHISNKTQTIDIKYILQQEFKDFNLKEISNISGIPFNELNNAINSNEKLSLSTFQELCKYLELSAEEESFWYSHYIYDTNNEIFQIIAFYKYLLNEYGINLCYINDSYIAACISFCKKFNITPNINYSALDKEMVTNIIENLDKYKEIIQYIYEKDLYHSEINIKKLTDEEYYNLYKKLIETLDFELYKLEKNDFKIQNNEESK